MSTNNNPKQHAFSANAFHDGLASSAKLSSEDMLAGLGQKVQALAVALSALAPALEALPAAVRALQCDVRNQGRVIAGVGQRTLVIQEQLEHIGGRLDRHTGAFGQSLGLSRCTAAGSDGRPLEPGVHAGPQPQTDCSPFAEANIGGVFAAKRAAYLAATQSSNGAMSADFLGGAPHVVDHGGTVSPEDERHPAGGSC